MPATVYEFGSFRLDPSERLLLRGAQAVPVTPKAFDLLLYLVEHAGRLVGKQELMDALWPSTSVEETNLTFTIGTSESARGRSEWRAMHSDRSDPRVPLRRPRYSRQ